VTIFFAINSSLLISKDNNEDTKQSVGAISETSKDNKKEMDRYTKLK